MKKQYIALVVLFCILLFCVPVSFLLNQWIVLDSKYMEQNFEKRSPFPLPDVRQTGFTAWPDAMEEYFRDHLAFRHAIIQFNAEANKLLLNSTASRKILLGKEGWIFFKDHDEFTNIADYQGIIPLEQSLAEETALLLEQVALRQKKLDRLTVFTISPNKETVYSRYLPEGITQINSVSRSDMLMHYLQENAPTALLADPKQLLLQAAETDSRLYYKTDSHWTVCGAYIGVATILDVLNVEYVPYCAEDFHVNGQMGGDMGPFGGLELDYEDAYSRNWEQEHAIEKITNGAIVTYMSDAKDPRSVLVLGDSFRYHMEDVLPHYFAEVSFMAFSEGGWFLVDEYDPDILIIQQVERNIENFKKFLPFYIP